MVWGCWREDGGSGDWVNGRASGAWCYTVQSLPHTGSSGPQEVEQVLHAASVVVSCDVLNGLLSS